MPSFIFIQSWWESGFSTPVSVKIKVTKKRNNKKIIIKRIYKKKFPYPSMYISLYRAAFKITIIGCGYRCGIDVLIYT